MKDAKYYEDFGYKLGNEISKSLVYLNGLKASYQNAVNSGRTSEIDLLMISAKIDAQKSYLGSLIDLLNNEIESL